MDDKIKISSCFQGLLMPYKSTINILQTDTLSKQKLYVQSAVIYNDGKSAHCQNVSRRELTSTNIFSTIITPPMNNDWMIGANSETTFIVHLPTTWYDNIAPRAENLTIFFINSKYTLNYLLKIILFKSTHLYLENKNCHTFDHY
jgi:hypothetical protein